MQKPLTTNRMRELLTAFGAIKPSRRAVAMIANKVDNNGNADIWDPVFHDEDIKRAVQAAVGLKGEASYEAFGQALRQQVAA